MKKVILALFFLGAIAVFSTVSNYSVLAYTIEDLGDIEVEGDFTVGPGKSEIYLDPGETTVRNLLITNRLGKEAKFLLITEDFRGDPTGRASVILLGEEKGPYTLKDYLKPEVTEFILKHGERITLPVEIYIPEDAEPGGRYGAVLVSQTSELSDAETAEGAGGQVKITARIGALFFVRVKGDVEESGFLEGFQIRGPKKIFYEKGPFIFDVLFRNNGNVHLNPYGVIEIKNLAGRTIEIIEMKPWFAMPDSLRFKEVKFEKINLFGRYTATVKVNRGYSDIIDEKTVVFWVLPWKFIAMGLGVIVLIVLFFWWFSRTFEIKKKKKEELETIDNE